MKNYLESSPSGDGEYSSAARKVKFLELEGIRQQLPSSEYSHSMISQLVQEAFPSAEQKRFGKKAITYVLSIEPASGIGCYEEHLQPENQRLKEELRQPKYRRKLDASRGTFPSTIESELVLASRISSSAGKPDTIHYESRQPSIYWPKLSSKVSYVCR